jgi:alkaline phosphatase
MRKIFKVMTIVIVSVFCFASCNNCKDNTPTAKYIFYFIGDGMGNTHVALTESYLSYKAGKENGERLSFTQFPYLALAETWPIGGHITCSSASGTALACGIKTTNNSLGVDPDGNEGTSIAVELHNQGYNVGIMSSVPVNHATPASFFAHNEYRGNYYEISQDMIDDGFEFFGGAGLYDIRGKKGDLPSTLDFLEENGYAVCYGKSTFTERQPNSEKVVYLQPSSQETGPEYYVREGDKEGDIQLSEMLGLCIDHLGDEEPFIIVCEEGRIDWSAHGNKTMSMVHDVLSLNETVKKALEFYYAHPDETLIVVTADHETGGPAIGDGQEWKSDFIDWEILEKSWIECGGKNNLNRQDNRALNYAAQVGWTTENHSGAPVPVYAIGKGAERFHGRINNIDIKGLILGK